MKIKNTLLKMFRYSCLLFVIVFGLMAIVGSNGGGGDGGGDDGGDGGGGSEYSLSLGDWSGDDISFTITEGSYYVNDLSVTYRGHADGTICNYDYENESTIGASIPVTNNTFSYESSSLTINGEFLSETSVEVNISWSSYDSHCDATESGSTLLMATPESGGDGGGGGDGDAGDGGSDLGEVCLEISYDYQYPFVLIKDKDTMDTIKILPIQFIQGCLYDEEMQLVGCWTNLEQDENGKITNLDISIDDTDFEADDYNYPRDECI